MLSRFGFDWLMICLMTSQAVMFWFWSTDDLPNDKPSCHDLVLIDWWSVRWQAKLSCLVGKCQQRNSLLVQLMRALRRYGCLDYNLTQEAEDLLNDTALQDYASTFTPPSTAALQENTPLLPPAASERPERSQTSAAASTAQVRDVVAQRFSNLSLGTPSHSNYSTASIPDSTCQLIKPLTTRIRWVSAGQQQNCEMSGGPRGEVWNAPQ